MRSCLIILLSVLLYIPVIAQERVPKATLPAFNIFNLNDYSIEGETIDLYVIKYTIRKKDNPKPFEFTLKPNTLEAFKENFKPWIDSVMTDPIRNDSPRVNAEMEKLFYFFIASERAIASVDEAPDAGKLCLEKVAEIRRELFSQRELKKRRNRLKRQVKAYDKKVNDLQDSWLNTAVLDRLIVRRNSVTTWDKTVSDTILEISLALRSPDRVRVPDYLTDKSMSTLNRKDEEGEDSQTERINKFISKHVNPVSIKKLTREYAELKVNRDYDGLQQGGSKKREWETLLEKHIVDTEDARNEEKINREQKDYDDKTKIQLAAVSRLKEADAKLTELKTKLAALDAGCKRVTDKVAATDARMRLWQGQVDAWMQTSSKRPSIPVQIIPDYEQILKLMNDSLVTLDALIDGLRQNITDAETATTPDLAVTTSQVEALRSKELLERMKRRQLNKFKDDYIDVYERLQRETLVHKASLDSCTAASSYYQKEIDTQQPVVEALKLDTATAKRSWRDACFRYSRVLQDQMSHQYTVDRMQVEFNDGFMENIVVEGNFDESHVPCNVSSSGSANFLKFSNRYVIGFSRKVDFRAYKEMYALYAERDGRVYTLPLEKLFPDFIETLQVDRRDYSPEDQVITWEPEKGECKTLKKEQYYKIFEAKVYSDFVGVFGEEKPNGLVQTEIDRRLNIVTAKRTSWLGRGVILWGTLSYIEPQVTFSKLESNNRRLELGYRDNFVNGAYSPEKFASTLKLREYQNFSVGFDLNALTIDLPGLKSTFYADLGFRYGRTAIVDSLRSYTAGEVVKTRLIDTYGVNTLDIYPNLTWQLRADERYSFNFSWSHHGYYLRDHRFSQVADQDHFIASKSNGRHVRYNYNRIVLQVNVKPVSTSKGNLFFRYQFFWQQKYWNTTFAQAQVGYSFYLLSNRKE